MWAAPHIVHEALSATGRPLDRETREFMEPRFGRDLSAVRIHTGAQAAASARAVNARAYTAGNRIVWGEGSYAPHTDAGKRLLAHELAHVVQLDGMPPGAITTIRRQPAGAATAPLSDPDRDTPQLVDSNTGRAKQTGMRNGQMQVEAETNLRGLGKMGSKAARIKDSTKNTIQGKVEQALRSPAPAEGEGAGKEDGSGAQKSLAGLSTGNLAVIDTELAEHQRWGAAASKVGAAASGQRAEFVAQSAAGGSNFLESLGKGAVTGAGIKLLEKGAEKGALKLAAKFAPAVGKFAPLPAVGAVIGGVMSAYDLASRDWKATGESVGRFGQGADVYDTLANSIESISTVIDVATGVLNVIAGVIGAISIAMWIITILTVGVASPLAATLSTIAGGIGLASMALDGINSLVLKQLITVFRALHTFTSEADPRDVVTQGNAIGQAAGAATGFLAGLGGGLAGGAIAEKGVHMASGKPSAKVPDHPNPGPRAGEGPSVKAEPGEPAVGATHETTSGSGVATETATGTAEHIQEATPPVTPETSPGTPASASAPNEIAQVAEAPHALEVTAVPETPGAPEMKADPLSPSVTEAVPVAPDAPLAPDQARATETSATPEKVVAPEPEVATESSPEREQTGGGDDAKPNDKPLTAKERARLRQKILSGDLSPGDIEKLAQHAGVSPEAMKTAIDRAEIETQGGSTGMKDKDVSVASSDQKKPFLEKFRDREGNWQMERMPGRPETPARVKNWARRMARRAAGRIIQESLRSGVDDAYTSRAREFLDAGQLKYIRKNGKLPRGVEFHHLFTVADFPEFAHLAEVGTPMSAKDHSLAGHGGDTSRPLETPELLNPEALQSPSLSEDVEARKGARMKKGTGALVESKRQMGRHEAAAGSLREGAENARREGHRGKARRLDREARDQEHKARLIRDALPELEALLRSASDEARQDLGRAARTPMLDARPAEQPPTSPAVPASAAPAVNAPPAPAAAPVPAVQPASAPEAGQPSASATSESGEAPANTTESAPDRASELRAKAIAETPPIRQPEPVRESHPIETPAATPQASPDAAISGENRRVRVDVGELPNSQRLRIAPEAEAGVEQATQLEPQSEREAAVEPAAQASGLRMTLPVPSRSGGGAQKQDKESQEPESGLMRNIRAMREMDPGKMSTVEKGVFVAGGAFAGTAAVNTMRGFEEARREPIVEHVNPSYSPPPCTPQGIVDVQNEILETLDARAQSEEAAAVMAGQEAHHKANQKPLADMQKNTGEAISAAEAHKQAVDRRTQANEKKKEHEDHAQGTVADYSNRAAKLSVITVPMRGFERFTSLAHSLPDNEESLSPLVKAAIGPAFGTLISAKHGIMKMNTDSKRFLDQLDAMDKTMEQQKAAQGERDKQVAADASTLRETGKNADESGRELNKTEETSKELDTKNQDRIAEAGKLHQEASQTAATLDAQAQQKQARAQNLASGLQEWAQIHLQAREDSLEQTKSNLQQQGYRITEVKEL
jgi:hypothetical protein